MFQTGWQIGLKPDEVLDMSFDMFCACVRGYSDRMFDIQLTGVQTGFYAGYYSRERRPKSLNSVMQKMVSSRKRKIKSKTTPELDIDTFLARERKRKEWLSR